MHVAESFKQVLFYLSKGALVKLFNKFKLILVDHPILVEFANLDRTYQG